MIWDRLRVSLWYWPEKSCFGMVWGRWVLMGFPAQKQQPVFQSLWIGLKFHLSGKLGIYRRWSLTLHGSERRRGHLEPWWFVMVSATVSLCDCICTKTCTPIYAHTQILCIYCCVYWYQYAIICMHLGNVFNFQNTNVYSVCHVDVCEPISHISKPIGCAPKRGAAETSSPGQASIGFLTQMTGWEWRILVGWVSPYQVALANENSAKRLRIPIFQTMYFFYKSPLLSKPLAVAELWNIYQEIHQNGFRFTSLFLADSIGSSTFLPLLAISFGRNRLGALDGGNRRCPVSTPFGAMAKAASPLLRPWFSSRSWYLFSEQKL